MKNKIILGGIGGLLVVFIELLLDESGAILTLGLLAMILSIITVKKITDRDSSFYKKSLLAVTASVIYFISLIIFSSAFISDGIEYHTIFNDCMILKYYDELNPSGRELVHIAKHHIN